MEIGKSGFVEIIENFTDFEETIETFQWFWGTPSPLNVFWYSDHCQRWFFNGFWVAQPLVSMVFDGQGPLVKWWNGENVWFCKYTFLEYTFLKAQNGSAFYSAGLPIPIEKISTSRLHYKILVMEALNWVNVQTARKRRFERVVGVSARQRRPCSI